MYTIWPLSMSGDMAGCFSAGPRQRKCLGRQMHSGDQAMRASGGFRHAIQYLFTSWDLLLMQLDPSSEYALVGKCTAVIRP